MICYDRDAASGAEQTQRTLQQVFECVELVVDFDAERLKHFCEFFLTACGVDERIYHLEQLLYRVDALCVAGFHDCRGQTAGVLELAEQMEYIGKPLFGICVDKARGGHVAAAVHAHVERAVPTE